MPLEVFGKPVRSYASAAGNQLYTLPSDANGLRLPAPSLAQDMALILSRHKHRALISDSRYIAETFPLVAGAIKQKADYVCQAGFTPNFQGKNRAWGRRAQELLVQAHKVVNVRGPQFDFNRSWRIGCTMFDIDGDYFVLLSKSATGYPQLQFMEGHRVGSRYGETEVLTGRYKDLTILNGIIYNRAGRAVAYRFLGEDPSQDRDVSARDCIHCGIPRWFSAGRPVPTLTHSILDWYDVKETRGYQKLKAKINAAHVIVEHTPDGKAPPSAAAAASVNWQRAKAAAEAAGGTAPPPPGTPTTPLVDTIAGGLIRYVKAGGGAVTTHMDATPTDQNMRFDETLIRGALFGMDWRSEMLDLSKLSGAPTRGFADQINTAIYQRWLDLTPNVLQTDLYLLACLIQRGDIEKDPEWFKWTYTAPADFTVDQGRTSAADLESVRAGAAAMPEIIGRNGRTSLATLRDQAEYLKEKAEVEAEYGLAPGALGRLDKPGQSPDAPDVTETKPPPEKSKPPPKPEPAEAAA